ncbi:polysaccharide deacetylase family protein [Peribacillus kribbensis]|uniref:polysaccharide deacetylase family protein n=1 Tax=Peribacillus kribbensis TaxID=356658 RepID=UPI00041E7BEB|nr:polysaccharide deacetylase family protein [Peribacillus kribbensis]
MRQGKWFKVCVVMLALIVVSVIGIRMKNSSVQAEKRLVQEQNKPLENKTDATHPDLFENNLVKAEKSRTPAPALDEGYAEAVSEPAKEKPAVAPAPPKAAEASKPAAEPKTQAVQPAQEKQMAAVPKAHQPQKEEPALDQAQKPAQKGEQAQSGGQKPASVPSQVKEPAPRQPANVQPPKAGSKVIYLTFDDGPSRDTLKLIDTLNAYGVKGTFFMLEPNMRSYPGTISALKKNGEVLGLHGVTHDAKKIYRSPQTVVTEMTAAQNTLRKMTGIKTNLIRTPYGSSPYMKPDYMKAVNNAGFKLWDWTIDTNDWRYKNGEFVSKTIKDLEHYPYRTAPRILLMHDKQTTIAHLGELLICLKKNGYSFGLLNEGMKPYSQEH